MWRQIAQQISQTINDEFECLSVDRLSGGDINQAAKISDSKHRFFIKWNHIEKLNMFETEAISLNTIAATNTIRVPQVITCGVVESSSFLVLEFLEIKSVGQPQDFAKALAAMHLSNGDKFGFSSDNFIGSTPQTNQWHVNWVEFYQQQRLGTQKDLLRLKGASTRLLTKLTQLQSQLAKFFVNYTPKPALVHGDLWQGNYGYVVGGTPTIYDPACYYADFEVDLAMMELFGNPGERFFQAYHQHNPIDSGYQKRKQLYNLYHILNHANLFGGGYAAQAETMIERLLAE